MYNHRIALWIALCRAKSEAGFVPWRSKVHSDGTAIDGWFILGFDWARGKQITYHLPMGRWSETEFAHTLDKAPEWDGHTSADVLERLETL